MSASKASKARICAAVLVMAATEGCRDSQNATGRRVPQRTPSKPRLRSRFVPARAPQPAPIRSLVLRGRRSGPAAAQRTARRRTSSRVRMRRGDLRTAGASPNPGPLRRRAQRVIDAYSARYSGPTSRLTQRVRLNTQQKLKQTRIDLTVSRPSKQIIVQPKTRDDQRSCPLPDRRNEQTRRSRPHRSSLARKGPTELSRWPDLDPRRANRDAGISIEPRRPWPPVSVCS